MSKYRNILDLVNQVALETGLAQVQSVTSTQDAAIKQLVALVLSCGSELLNETRWEALVKEHSITTQEGDTGVYPLPPDFAYMIPQTHWDRANRVPMAGSLSPQTWQYLVAADLSPLYVSFRQMQGSFVVQPQPPPAGVEISFEYVCDKWIESTVTGPQARIVPAKVSDLHDSDKVLFEHYLFERLLKLRFLEARGLNSQAAEVQYMRALAAVSGKDTSAPLLDVTARARYPYIGTQSIPWTNFGK